MVLSAGGCVSVLFCCYITLPPFLPPSSSVRPHWLLRPPAVAVAVSRRQLRGSQAPHTAPAPNNNNGVPWSWRQRQFLVVREGEIVRGGCDNHLRCEICDKEASHLGRLPLLKVGNTQTHDRLQKQIMRWPFSRFYSTPN